MQTILVLDAHNYDETLPEIRRTAIRGVIFRDGQLLLVRSSFGEVKFPGGGQEAGEDDTTTLMREVLEETGYHIKPESIRPFGQVEEKRLSTHEPMIWHQINRYYFCDIQGEQGACAYSDNEKKYGMRQVWLPLPEAVAVNRQMLAREGCNPWNQREYRVLELLMKTLEAKEQEG
ncbi:MAG: NUDIX domain-containing protein [Clostridia bacterium]|nr:NUDIX domain-containing protein [Clostridia bacterium]